MVPKPPKKNTNPPSRVLYPEPQSGPGLSTKGPENARGPTLTKEPGALPIDDLLPKLVSTLLTHRRLILTAPPGAGKTTQVPPALASALPRGKILTLQPRRVAARAMARHMAAESGQPLGQHIGYQIRHDNRTTPTTRIILMTEGLLTRKLSSDPLLEDTACVIIDEFHERSQHADLALALLRELLEVRDDFHLLIMSATLSGLVKPLQNYLGNCPHLHCDPRTHPLHIHHIDRPDDRYLDQQIRAALLRLLQADNDDQGDILVFLPGAGAISRCHRLLEEQPLPGKPDIQELFGAQSAKEQDQALSPGSRRRVVLATNLAETSLTVPGVTAVVDCGRVKRLRFDPQNGMDRLSEERVSQASADQRAGRAGRIAPGRAERLWLASDHVALALQEEAELKRVDVAPVLLNLLQHQSSDPRSFAFFEAPPLEAMDKALDLLRMLGALSATEFRLSPLGQRMAALPLHPRLGRLLCDAGALGLGETGALLCALLSEQDIRRRIAGGPYTADLENILDMWHRGQGLNPGSARQVRAAVQQLERSLPGEQRKDSHEATAVEIRRLVLAAYPDRVGKRQTEGSRQAVLAHGRGVEIDDGGALGSSNLFIAIRADAGRRGQHSRGRVYLALALEAEDLSAVFPELLRESNEAVFEEASGSVLGLRRQRFGDLLLSEQSGVTVEPSLAASVLAKAALENFELVLRPDKAGKAFITRLAFAAHHLPEHAWPKVDKDSMRQRLASQCHGRRSLGELKKLNWKSILSAELHGPLRRLLENQVPERIKVPSGRTLAIEYAAKRKDPPVLKVKLQEMFGTKQTPSIASGRVLLTLHLLAPNGRPAQVTQDLANFWREGYALVRKDLRGRYPKHPWPEDPTKAQATAKTKKRIS